MEEVKQDLKSISRRVVPAEVKPSAKTQIGAKEIFSKAAQQELRRRPFFLFLSHSHPNIIVFSASPIFLHRFIDVRQFILALLFNSNVLSSRPRINLT
jgi:hypothetical protein